MESEPAPLSRCSTPPRKQPPEQVPELRLVCGDILRQDYDALLAGMHAHAEELSGGGSAAQQGGDGEGGGSAGGGPQQDVQQPAASASQGPRQIKVRPAQHSRQQIDWLTGGRWPPAGCVPSRRLRASCE